MNKRQRTLTCNCEQFPLTEPWTVEWWLRRQFETSELISIDPTDSIHDWIDKNAPLDFLEYDSLFNALEYSTQVPPYNVRRFRQYDDRGWTNRIRVRGPLSDLIIHAHQLNELTTKINDAAERLAESRSQTEMSEEDR